MKPKTSLFFWVAVLLLTSTYRKLYSGLQTVSADSVNTLCAGNNTDYGSVTYHACSPGQYCGINKLTGKFGCVPADQCPDNGDTAKTETIVCSATKPYCCCRTKWNGGTVTSKLCNNLKNTKDDTQWKQGCSLPELKNFPYCKINPTSKVFCNWESGGKLYNKECGVHNFCGIDKTSGELKQCRHTTDCPDSAASSREIVCEPGKPYCCCQVHTPKGKNPVGHNCHNFKEDPSIWKQACGLKELRDLDVCKRGPPTTTTTSTTTTTTTTTTTITEEPSVTTGKAGVSTTEAPEGPAEDLMSEDTNEGNVVIVVIIIVIIIVLLIIGGLVYYCFFKRRAAKVAATSTPSSADVHGHSDIGL